MVPDTSALTICCCDSACVAFEISKSFSLVSSPIRPCCAMKKRENSQLSGLKESEDEISFMFKVYKNRNPKAFCL